VTGRYGFGRKRRLLSGALLIGLACMGITIAKSTQGLIQDSEVGTYARARECGSSSPSHLDCYQSYTAQITALGVMYASPNSDCAAVITSELGDEVFSYDCGDTDVISKGETVTVRKWRGEIVEVDEPQGTTKYGLALGASGTQLLAGLSVVFAGFLAVIFIVGMLIVIGGGLLPLGAARPAPVSADALWWWDGSQWLRTTQDQIAKPAPRWIGRDRLGLALLVGLWLSGSILVAIGTVAGTGSAGPPSSPCGLAQSGSACYELYSGNVEAVRETPPCSVTLGSGADANALQMACSDTYLFQVGRFQSARFWRGELYWVSQGTDPTTLGFGWSWIFILLIPIGLAALGTIAVLVVQELRSKRPAFIAPSLVNRSRNA
jgi:hypothetical protein